MFDLNGAGNGADKRHPGKCLVSQRLRPPVCACPMCHYGQLYTYTRIHTYEQPQTTSCRCQLPAPRDVRLQPGASDCQTQHTRPVPPSRTMVHAPNLRDGGQARICTLHPRPLPPAAAAHLQARARADAPSQPSPFSTYISTSVLHLYSPPTTPADCEELAPPEAFQPQPTARVRPESRRQIRQRGPQQEKDV